MLSKLQLSTTLLVHRVPHGYIQTAAGDLFHETNLSQMEDLEMERREIVAELQTYKEQVCPP